jgi:two-component system sensor kinase FixL
VTQIVLNLFVNADRALASRSDGRILIGVVPARDGFKLTVDDNGPGLADSGAAQAFAPSISADDSGLGLGLSVSRWLAERDGGSLQLSDSRMNGCAVTLFLPPAP